MARMRSVALSWVSSQCCSVGPFWAAKAFAKKTGPQVGQDLTGRVCRIGHHGVLPGRAPAAKPGGRAACRPLLGPRIGLPFFPCNRSIDRYLQGSHPGGRPLADHPPLIRQWLLLRVLSARRYGATVAEMASEMGVSVKTVRRDLVAFQQAGFPLEEHREKHGRKVWRLHPGCAPGISFTLDEALALYLGRRLLDPLAGTYLWDAAQRAFRKVRACLGTNALNYIERLTGRVHATAVGASDYSAKAELVDELFRATEDRLQTIITYQSQRSTEPVEYAVDPLGLIYHKGSLYLVAFSHDHDEIRHFKVDRIDEIEVGKLPFVPPEGFVLAEHLSGSFGMFHGDGEVRVRVRFSASVVRYVLEGRWHASQRLTRERDGSVLAEFQLSTTEEIMRWLFSFGRHAEVLEPQELRRAMAQEIGFVARYYEPESSVNGAAVGQPLARLKGRPSR